MSLFDTPLPTFPPALPEDELQLLRMLPDYGDNQCVTEVSDEWHAAARRLERRQLIKIQREKTDDLAFRPTWFAGVLPAGRVRPIT